MQVAWSDWLASRRAEHTARVVTGVLALALVYLLARLTWQLIPAPEPEIAPGGQVSRSTTAPAPQQGARVDTNRIARWHLFGEAAAPAPEKQAAPIDAPETRLNLTLRGVFSTDDRERARAIVAAPNGQEKTYRIGEELPGGAELSDIYADRIILLRNGRHETLKLPKSELDTGVQRRASPAGGVGPRAAAILRDYRGRMDTNPRSLIDLVRPVPHRTNNEFAGFRLYPGNRPELFRELGLRPGDLVTRVNGIVLDSAAKGMQVLQNLRENDSISLQIRRGQQELNLAFQLS